MLQNTYILQLSILGALVLGCSGEANAPSCEVPDQACDCGSTLGTQTCTSGVWGTCVCSDSGADAPADVQPDGPCPCGPLETCFEDKFCVAKMTTIENLYKIDQTEVTRGQYQAWLATGPTIAGQPKLCSFNTTFEPPGFCINDPLVCQGNCDQHPQVCVDWCDAFAYCKAVGKRLCGKIGGGANAWNKFDDPSASQWHRACTSGGVNAYPYGNSYEPETCEGHDRVCTYPPTCSTSPVGVWENCSSPLEGFGKVFDLSGNVYEWEDSCSDPNVDQCRVRGGNFSCSEKELNCADESAWPDRNGVGWGLGFRCCLD